MIECIEGFVRKREIMREEKIKKIIKRIEERRRKFGEVLMKINGVNEVEKIEKKVEI